MEMVERNKNGGLFKSSAYLYGLPVWRAAALPVELARNSKQVSSLQPGHPIIAFIHTPYPFHTTLAASPCMSLCQIFIIAMIYPPDWIDNSPAR